MINVHNKFCLASFVLTALVTGCQEAEPEPDTPSLESFLVIQESGEEALIAALTGLSDADRMVMVDMLILQKPMLSTWDLCAGLTQQQAIGSCEGRLQRTRGRPHLWGNAAPNERGVDMNAAAPVRMREAIGPGQTSIQLSEVESLYSGLSPIPSSCTVEDYDCRILEARHATTPTDSVVAGQICMSVRDRRWREECFFRVAEDSAVFLEQRETALRDSIEFCLLAGEFRNYCAEQIFARSIDLAPPLYSPRSSWAPALVQLSALREQWSDRPESAAMDIEQRFWSVLVQRSVSVSQDLCGDPMDWLPEAASVHFRSAIAFRYVGDALESGRPPGEDLEAFQGWVTGLRDILSVRCNGQGEPMPEDTRWRFIADFWPTDEAGDDNIPAVTYLNGARRPYDGQDSDIDEVIVTLEALARFDQVPDSLIMSVRNHESEILRWTAERLYQKRMVRPPNSSYEGP